jgi:hypothetical protein
MAPRHGACPGAIPGDRTNFHRPCASLRDRVSKTQSARGGTGTACHFSKLRVSSFEFRVAHGGDAPDAQLPLGTRNQSRGRGRQAMHLPCKQAHVGALPTDSTISLRGTRPVHRGEPHKLVQTGATPVPATTLRACRVTGDKARVRMRRITCHLPPATCHFSPSPQRDCFQG